MIDLILKLIIAADGLFILFLAIFLIIYVIRSMKDDT